MPLTKFGKDDIKTVIDEYNGAFQEEEIREDQGKTENFVNNYYDVATTFYEYGWGKSFHFAPQHKKETFREAVLRHEYYLALKLGIKASDKVLDVGCGIGGPALNIARFTEGNVLGVNINKYQIQRAHQIMSQNKMSDRVKMVEASFMEIPREDEYFDKVYAIEATCHAQDQFKVYNEVFRVLKPGGLFACYEWCLTDKYDPENPEHRETKRLIELGDALPDIRTVKETLECLEKVGFQVLEHSDRTAVTDRNDVPWYRTIDHGFISFSPKFKTSKVGLACTHVMISVMETLRLAPKGTVKCHNTLKHAVKGLTRGGKSGVFTPALFFVVRKPEE